jgi:tetratricopeptide (TPR) repeat protein
VLAFALERPRWRLAAACVALAAVAASTGATRRQTAFWTTSEALWTRALEIEPENPLAHLNLAHACIERAEHEREASAIRAQLDLARALLERGLALKRDPLFLAALAHVHELLWKLDPKSIERHDVAALDTMREAVKLAGEKDQLTPDYHLNLGSALFNAGRTDEAIAELEEYLRERPRSFTGRLDLGLAYLRVHRAAEGVRELETALSLEPSHVQAWGSLGVGYEELGLRDRAVDAYRKVEALELDRSSSAFRTASARLAALGAAK